LWGTLADLCGVGLLPLVLISGCLSAQAPSKHPTRIPYDLSAPTKVFELSSELTEICALTDIDSITVACVQDEQATVHFISLRTGAITASVPFDGPADMEGLTRVGDALYALRSDGLIYHLTGLGKELTLRDTFRLDVPNTDIEGLGYDESTARILISPKDLIKGPNEAKDARLLYAIDPTDPTHKVETVLTLSMDALATQAAQQKIELPTRTTDDGRVRSALKLRYSSVAVHPMGDHFYLLSATDRTLLVVDRTGTLIDLVLLGPELLPKPEGITFLANGDLLLSSEGKGRTPVLVRYQYQPAR